MRVFTAIVLSTALAAAQAPAPDARTAAADTPQATELRPRPVGTMSQLMVDIIYPTSDALFYVATRVPEDGPAWTAFQGKMLMLAESANLLMMPGRARDEGQWMKDSDLLRQTGMAAYKAALAKDVEALAALNDPLYQSCTSCHRAYRPDYGRRRQTQQRP